VKLSVVVPAHDEADNLPACVDAIEAALAEADADLRPASIEIVAVDDGSTDATWATIAALAGRASGARVIGMRLSRNFGKEAAISAGLRRASGDAVVVMDADLQHPPALLPQMLAAWRRGDAMVVEVDKHRRQRESWLRGWAARGFYRAFRLGSGLDMANSSDFKLLDRRVVDEYLRLAESRRFFRALTRWLGFPTVTLYMDPGERATGPSRWRLRDLLEMGRRTIVSFSSLPLRLISWAGVAGLLFSAVLGVQTLWYHFQGYAEEGFPTVIILILGMGSAILLSLGLIGEYVASIYEEVKSRPQYVVLDTTTPARRDDASG
jgi:glycosyltransferase involved in cell wall biosynthesis